MSVPWKRSKLQHRHWSRLLILSALLSLSGCANYVSISKHFPSPVIDALPLKAGLYLDHDFRHYTFHEKSAERGQWTVKLGPAQAALLTGISDKLFASTSLVGDYHSGQRHRYDWMIVPSVEVFQFATPNETKDTVFEAWLKYRIRIYRSDGQLLADWLTSAYGKTPTATLRAADEALSQALELALRDLGLNLSTRLSRVPELRAWLKQASRLASQQGAKDDA